MWSSVEPPPPPAMPRAVESNAVRIVEFFGGKREKTINCTA